MTLFEGRGHSVLQYHRIVRYLLVGSASFLLDVGSIWLCYRMFHLPIVAATTMGFVAGLSFNFTASKMFTFDVRSDTPGQTLRYTILLGVNYLLTLTIVSSSEAWGPGYLAGKLCSVGLIACSNYLVLHRWVFVTPSSGLRISQTGFAENNMQNIGKDRTIERGKQQGNR